MSFLQTLKNLLNPKALLAQAIDSLDYLVGPLAHEIEKGKKKLAEMDSEEKAQWLVDRVQAFLREKFKISAE